MYMCPKCLDLMLSNPADISKSCKPTFKENLIEPQDAFNPVPLQGSESDRDFQKEGTSGRGEERLFWHSLLEVDSNKTKLIFFQR